MPRSPLHCIIYSWPAGGVRPGRVLRRCRFSSAEVTSAVCRSAGVEAAPRLGGKGGPCDISAQARGSQRRTVSRAGLFAAAMAAGRSAASRSSPARHALPSAGIIGPGPTQTAGRTALPTTAQGGWTRRQITEPTSVLLELVDLEDTF